MSLLLGLARNLVLIVLLGYGDAAVKLQRDWNVDAENLPFAHHIKGQALVSLVQKGLRYHHLSLTIDEVGAFTPLVPRHH